MNLLGLMRCLFMRAEGPQEPPEDPHTARRSMRRIISDDDDRSPRERSSSNPEELANTMRTEDELRDQLFENPLPEPKPHRSVARNAPVGANPAYHLARKAAPRVYCCGCCGTWLARPQDVVDERKQAVAVGLDDCERTVCLQNVGNLKEAGAAHSATCGVWQYRICGVRCSGCSAFLGVKVKSLERLPDDRTALNPRNMHDLLAELFSDSRGVRTSPPVATWLQDVAQQQPLATATAVDAPARSSRASRSRSPTPDALAAALIAPGSRVEIEQVFLGTRPVNAVVPLLCKACGANLSYTDQLLCTKRRWGFGNTPPSCACYVNSLAPGSYTVRGEYEEHLAQGLMDMADVHCKCGRQVGYRFCRDKTPTGRNQNQIGRFGLVASCFIKAPFQLEHHDVFGPSSHDPQHHHRPSVASSA